MVDRHKELAHECFTFLKEALGADKGNQQLFRGPEWYEKGRWRSEYQQKGGIVAFKGRQEITYRDQLVFWHWIIGGVVVSK